MSDYIRAIQEYLDQLVSMRPIALKDNAEGTWSFFPSKELINEGLEMRERVMILMIERETR